MSYVLALSIGPVQEFIAAARKTRDLWFGSYMLSEICRATAKALTANGAELVFPPPQAVSNGGPEKPAVANKIVAVIHGDRQPPAELAAKAKEAALAKLWEYGQEALTRARGIVDENMVQAQLADFLEFYAAWYPMDSKDKYAAALEQADLVLAGRKALRDFSQSKETDGKPKSSLDGGRQTVLKEGHEGQRLKLGIRPTEQLDGISLIKRVAEARRFVSVGRVAVDPLIRRLKAEKPQILDELNDISKKLADMDCPAVTRFSRDALPQYADFPYDCQLFHVNRETDRELNDWCGENPEGAQLVDSFAKTFRQAQMPEPPVYLAVLHADGDRMGAAIRSLETPGEHQKLSSALVSFAQQADQIVAKHQGALVYSGGDDVLAFLPLDTALECAKALSNAFAAAMQSVFGTSQAGGDSPIPPTLSVGISINHYGEHLGEMIEWSRQAEKAAKKKRNSLAVALHTRTAGEEAVTVSRQWDQKPVETLQLWVSLHRQDALPDRAPFDLRELHRELDSFSRELPESEQKTKISQVLADEVKRILKRKRGEHGKADLPKHVYEAVVSRVGEDLDSLRLAVDEMLIARRLAKAEDVANKPKLSVPEAFDAAKEGGRDAVH